MNILGIIPARYASSRFPGKPLAQIAGCTMIERVYRRAQSCSVLNRVVVATDDQRIYDHVHSFGGEVVLTGEANNGTERCVLVLDQLADGASFDIVVNIQGDEPLLDPAAIEAVCTGFENPQCDIATLVRRLTDTESLFNPNVVKCIRSQDQRAHYFSRQAIPYQRDADRATWLTHHPYFQHIGIYAYRNSVLRKIVQLAPSPLEMAEKLEQLRWIENNFIIFALETCYQSYSVDEPGDIERVEKIIALWT